MIGDSNAEESEDTLAYFLNCHNASNIVRDKTCFKSLNNPSCICIDLIITNKPGCFQITITTSIGLSDCHKFVKTILKASFKKALPKEQFNRDFKHFNDENFKNELHTKLGGLVKDCDLFEKTFLELLDEHAPVKIKFLRAFYALYMTKAIRKAIMKRSELKSKYYENQTAHDFEFYKKKQKNCTKNCTKKKL